MKNNKVSIIIPAYNAEKTIQLTLMSIIKQEYANFECIIIDDGSTDKTVERIKEISDNRIQLFRQENAGPSAARNLGLKHSKGKYICFVDSDDVIETDFLVKLLEGIKDTELVVCGYKKIFQNKKEKLFIPKIDGNMECKQLQLKVLSDIEINGYLWNKLFISSIIKSHNIEFNKDIYFGEDLIFVEEYLKYCNQVCVIKDLLYRYMDSDNSISRNISKKNIMLLNAYIEIWDFSKAKQFKEVLINKFFEEWLHLYECFNTDTKLLECYKKIIDMIKVDNIDLKKSLKKQIRIKYRMFLFDTKLYLLFMKIYRMLKKLQRKERYE